MKITIEFDENKVTPTMATLMTYQCLEDKGIAKRIKPDKNIKFKWDCKEVGILTQQGNYQVITRSAK